MLEIVSHIDSDFVSIYVEFIISHRKYGCLLIIAIEKASLHDLGVNGLMDDFTFLLRVRCATPFSSDGHFHTSTARSREHFGRSVGEVASSYAALRGARA
ncbi:hypothetical protein [Aminobacter sp. MSH1]|uniref:hypothetical protein n=1 Tax=Aminobacter sp. MSH1 TaxID=374606 RepID=UPI00190227F3|nr:hypothetical protein [Aminobacter sp. MSH1]